MLLPEDLGEAQPHGHFRCHCNKRVAAQLLDPVSWFISMEHMDVISVIVSTVLAILGSAWYSVVTHEWSHYLTGRAAGVPSKSIRVRMRPNPPHVALHDGHEWLSPDDAGYVETFFSYQSRIGWAWFYIAAGTIGELLAVLAAAVLLSAFGLTVMALILLGTSAGITLIYLIGDVALSRRYERPAGDFSSMWQITKPGTTALVAGVMVLYATALITIAGF